MTQPCVTPLSGTWLAWWSRNRARVNCAKAEGLNISRKVVPQVTVVQTGAVVLDATEFLAPHLESRMEFGQRSALPSLCIHRLLQHSSHLSLPLSF